MTVPSFNDIIALHRKWAKENPMTADWHTPILQDAVGEPIWYGMTLPVKKMTSFFGANPHVEDLFRDVLKLRGFTLDPVADEDSYMLRWKEGTRIPLYLRTLMDRLV